MQENTCATANLPSKEVTLVRIGYGEVDITPQLGIPCALGVDDECEEIFDPISVIAVAIGSGDETLILTAADLIGLGRPETLELRGLVSEATGVPADRVVIHCTHTHEAPSTRIKYGEYLLERGLIAYDPAYWERLQQAWVEAARTAIADMSSATAAWGVAKVDRVASNRRVTEPDGQITLRSSRAAGTAGRYPEGNIDPFVRVLRFDREEAAPVALITYCCHPSVAGGDEGPYITADICGVARAVLHDANGCSSIYMTGACGNTNPGKYAGLKSRKQDVMTLGYRLADAAQKAYETAEPLDSSRVSWGYRTVQLELREGFETAQELQAEVEQLVAEHKELNARGEKDPGGKFRRPLNRYLAATYADAGKLTTEVCALRLGDKGLIFYPAECFLELAYCLYAQYGQENIAVIENCDNTPAYILPPEAYAGGYEASACHTAPTAFGTLVGAALDLLAEAGLQ